MLDSRCHVRYSGSKCLITKRRLVPCRPKKFIHIARAGHAILSSRYLRRTNSAKETLDCIVTITTTRRRSASTAYHYSDKYLLDQSLELIVEKITRPVLHILLSSDHCAPTSSQEDDTNNNDDDAATSSNSVHFVMIRYHLSAS
jgi:hypothetical protein